MECAGAITDQRDVKIGRGTHLMHLESARLALWRESLRSCPVTILLPSLIDQAPIKERRAECSQLYSRCVRPKARKTSI
jgi:hypothetical protein